jgi:hypothetical protein
MAGIVPTIMYFKLSKKYLVWFLKKKMTEKKVAVLRKTAKESDEVNPNKC